MSKIQWFKRKAEDMNLAYAEEAINYLIDGNTGELEIFLELIEAMREEDVRSINRCLNIIQKNKGRIFDDGVYHLPTKNLGELLSEILDEADGIVNDNQEELEDEDNEEEGEEPYRHPDLHEPKVEEK